MKGKGKGKSDSAVESGADVSDGDGVPLSTQTAPRPQMKTLGGMHNRSTDPLSPVVPRRAPTAAPGASRLPSPASTNIIRDVQDTSTRRRKNIIIVSPEPRDDKEDHVGGGDGHSDGDDGGDGDNDGDGDNAGDDDSGLSGEVDTTTPADSSLLLPPPSGIVPRSSDPRSSDLRSSAPPSSAPSASWVTTEPASSPPRRGGFRVCEFAFAHSLGFTPFIS